MTLDFSGWFHVLRENPVLLVLIAGTLSGTAFTQAVKLTYNKLQPGLVSDARYQVAVWWLAILSAACFTKWWWFAIMPPDLHNHSLAFLTAVSAGFANPCAYWLLRRILRWWKPALADQLVDK